MGRFIGMGKLKELRESAKGGNPQAKAIIDKYMEDDPDMDSIERMMDEYYRGAGIDTLAKSGQGQPKPEPFSVEEDKGDEEGIEVQGSESEKKIDPHPTTGHTFDESKHSTENETFDNNMPIKEDKPMAKPKLDPTPVTGSKFDESKHATENETMVDIPKEGEEVATTEVNIDEDLDKELDGLIDDDEFDDESFSDFISNKRKNANRERKNAGYFRAFDQAGREGYLNRKKDSYGHSFDNRRSAINRKFRDTEGSIAKYSQMVTDLPDDEMELDVSKAGQAYDDFTQNEAQMGSFGRSWDDEDNQAMRVALEALVQQYGKKNVMAMLNTLKDDNLAWQKFTLGKIDNAVSNYGKSLDSLLK